MKVRIIQSPGGIYDLKVKQALKPGTIVPVHIAEHGKEPDTTGEWYLVETGVYRIGVYVSDEDAECGDIIRTYKNPNLGDYRTGPYQWISQADAEIVEVDNNENAKYLLSKNEWLL